MKVGPIIFLLKVAAFCFMAGAIAEQDHELKEQNSKLVKTESALHKMESDFSSVQIAYVDLMWAINKRIAANERVRRKLEDLQQQ
jgi:septal ring factor EnvC (AmiA/AmiB activator)